MKSFSSYLTERVVTNGNINLYVFDIDDTLFRTNTKIKVMKNGKVVKQLSGAEYNNYKLKDGETFNFNDFRSSKHFSKTAEPIDKVLDVANRLINKSGPKHQTIILTARENMDNKKEFLKTFRRHGVDIDKVYIERAGNFRHPSASKNKKIVFNKYLSTGKYSSVTFFDDSKNNITSFMSLRSKYPKIEFTGYHVQEDGTMRKIS